MAGASGFGWQPLNTSAAAKVIKNRVTGEDYAAGGVRDNGEVWSAGLRMTELSRGPEHVSRDLRALCDAVLKAHACSDGGVRLRSGHSHAFESDGFFVATAFYKLRTAAALLDAWERIVTELQPVRHQRRLRRDSGATQRTDADELYPEANKVV